MVRDCFPNVWLTAVSYLNIVSINDFTQLVGFGEVFFFKESRVQTRIANSATTESLRTKQKYLLPLFRKRVQNF